MIAELSDLVGLAPIWCLFQSQFFELDYKHIIDYALEMHNLGLILS